MGGRELQGWAQDGSLQGEASLTSLDPRAPDADPAGPGRPPQQAELAEAQARAEWQAGMLAQTEQRSHAASFGLCWPSGCVTLSPGLRALLGLAEDAPVQAAIEALAWLPPEDQALVLHSWCGAVPGQPFEFRHRVVCADGRRLDVLHRGMLLAGPGPGPGPGAEARGVALLQDITAQHMVEHRLQGRASQDEVTGFAWLVDTDSPDAAQVLRQRALAEVVETAGQPRLLARPGGDQMQGFWFSPPLVPSDVAALPGQDKCLPDRFLNRVRRSHTLLLVDDEENILSALKRLLRRDGYQIVTATSAADALQRLVEHEVDVIISDQRMPGMTGVEFLHRAKALYPHTVRMVLSGYTELQSIIDAVNKAGVYKFLTKPWDDKRLRADVAEAFRHKDLADENRRLSLQVETSNADLARLNERLEHLLTQQREHTELLTASAESTRGILDALPAAVLGVDPDGLVAYANERAEAMFSAAEGLLGRALCAVLPGWQPQGDAVTDLQLNGRRFQVRCCEFVLGAGPRGRLLVLLPQPAGTDA